MILATSSRKYVFFFTPLLSRVSENQNYYYFLEKSLPTMVAKSQIASHMDQQCSLDRARQVLELEWRRG